MKLPCCFIFELFTLGCFTGWWLIRELGFCGTSWGLWLLLLLTFLWQCQLPNIILSFVFSFHWLLSGAAASPFSHFHVLFSLWAPVLTGIVLFCLFSLSQRINKKMWCSRTMSQLLGWKNNDTNRMTGANWRLLLSWNVTEEQEDHIWTFTGFVIDL